MTTDKELADAYRLVKVDAWGREGGASAMAFATERINKLDPPKPIWPDGTVAWVTRSDGVKHVAQRINGEWVDMLYKDGSPSCAVYNSDVTKVEPLRVLGDDEIAIPRFPFTNTPKTARDYAGALQEAGFGLAALAFDRIADAREAEAGDAK